MAEIDGFGMRGKLAKLHAVYAGYGKCEKCRALPNNPCRMRDLSGRHRVVSRPCDGRTKTGAAS